MDESRIKGAIQTVAGKAQGAVGDLTGDARMQAEGGVREVDGKARQAFGETRDAVRDAAGEVADNTSDEVGRLRAQVEALLSEKVTPALAGVTEAAADYARDARAAVEDGADNAASAIKGRPLVAVAVVAVIGFLVGRLTATTQVHYHS